MKLTRILCCFIALALIGSCSVTVNAEEGNIQAETAEQLGGEEAEKAASYAADIDTNKLKGWPQGPNVYAGSAIVMDMDSGAILFGKKIEDRRYPASITKLLTVLVALENAELSDTVKFTEESISFLEPDYAQVGMNVGEELSLEQSLYAVLLASANEVSYAVAQSVGTQRLGGNYDTFIQKMNDRAKELGCTNSNWVNPHGLHDDNHYTTARDMALIAAAVYEREEFRKIMGTLEYKIGSTNLSNEERVFQQNHKMLWNENFYYDQNCKGGKTGYTDQSKTTLVTMADNGKMKIAAVTLYDYGADAYTDTKAMMDYVFNNFKKVSVKELETSKDIKGFQETEPFVVLPEGIKFADLKKQVVLTDKETRTGKVHYTYEGQDVGSAQVTLTKEGYQRLVGDAPASNENNVKNEKDHTFKNKRIDKSGGKSFKLYVVTGISLVVLLLLYTRFAYYKRRKARRNRRCAGRNGRNISRNDRAVGGDYRSVSRSDRAVGRDYRSVSRSDRAVGRDYRSVSRSDRAVGRDYRSVSGSDRVIGRDSRSVSASDRVVGRDYRGINRADRTTRNPRSTAGNRRTSGSRR